MTYFWIFIGGGLGSLFRFGLAQRFNALGAYSWGTFAANGLSCLALGVLLGWAGRHHLSPEARLFFITGFCGGFSTFSTFSNELLVLLRQGDYLLAGAYLLSSVVVGLAAVLVGLRIAGDI